MSFCFTINTETSSVFSDVDSSVQICVKSSGVCSVSAPNGGRYAFGEIMLAVPSHWTAREVAGNLFDFLAAYSDLCEVGVVPPVPSVWEPVLRNIDDLKFLAETGEIAVL